MTTATKPKRQTRPSIPAKLWGLWNRQTEHWVPTMDCSGGDEDPIMVLLTEHDAKIAAKRQNDMWDLDCVAVRIK